jgi:hypothetical protein
MQGKVCVKKKSISLQYYQPWNNPFASSSDQQQRTSIHFRLSFNTFHEYLFSDLVHTNEPYILQTLRKSITGRREIKEINFQHLIFPQQCN